MTANAMVEDRAPCRDAGDAGMDASLVTPVSKDDLRALLASVPWRKDPGVPSVDGGPSPRGEISPMEPDRTPHEAVDPVVERVVDPAREAAIRRRMTGLDPEGEDDDLVAGLMRSFVRRAGGTLASLRDAVEAADPDAVHRLSHSLKGSALNIGADRLAALCQTLEDAGRDGRLEGASQTVTLAEAEAELAAVTPVLASVADDLETRDRRAAGPADAPD